MSPLIHWANRVRESQKDSGKPLAVILSGHNGSGKSTMWYGKLADTFQIPLINADRMMVSILPETVLGGSLPKWATDIRDLNTNWMQVAQKGVQQFVGLAMEARLPFAMETVFSHWVELPGGGKVKSKIDLIRQMQGSGYFVLLFFVGLADVNLSVARVSTRAQSGGHNVALTKLHERFPRTQTAIRHAAGVADAAILVDNSGTGEEAFKVCRVQMGDREVYDCRKECGKPARTILQWLDIVSP